MDQIVDVATEDVVVGSVVLNPTDYTAVAQYIPELSVFTQNKAQALWVKIGKMRREGAHIDTLTVCTSITDDDISNGVTKGYVVDCTSNACASGLSEFYAQKIYEKYLLRKIVSEADTIKNNVVRHGQDIYELITSTHTLMGELLRVRPGKKFSIETAIQDAVKSMGDGDKRMIKTGYRRIDAFA